MKNYTKNKHWILLVLVIIACLIIAYALRSPLSVAPVTETQQTQVETPSAATVTTTSETAPTVEHAKLRVGDVENDIVFTQGETLYTALERMNTSGVLHLVVKKYTGLGFFVTEIGSYKQGVGGNLMYFINGREATVGVASYVLTSGDVIEWKLQ